MLKRVATPEELKFIRKNFKKMQYPEIEKVLGRTRGFVSRQVKLMGKRKASRRWTDAQLEYLDDHIGREPLDEIAAHIKRTPIAVRLACKRLLFNLNQRSNIYTSRAVQEELGLSCPKIVVAWLDRGYIQGQRAPFSYGKNQVRRFEYEDIIKCIHQRPWLCRIDRMPEGYFRSLVQQEWEKNPWYNSKEAAAFLGLADHNPIHRYIYQQLLPAVRRPMGGSKGEWIIRHKDLVEFQLHDPRPYHRKSVRLAETLENKLNSMEKRAWRALSEGKYITFGNYASVWVHLSSIDKKKAAPFQELIEIAKKKV